MSLLIWAIPAIEVLFVGGIAAIVILKFRDRLQRPSGGRSPSGPGTASPMDPFFARQAPARDEDSPDLSSSSSAR